MHIANAASYRQRRLTVTAGLSGALLFFAGMLFYGHLGPRAAFHEGMLATVKNASPARLFTGGWVGPVAACLCILGFWHVYLKRRRYFTRDSNRKSLAVLASGLFAGTDVPRSVECLTFFAIIENCPTYLFIPENLTMHKAAARRIARQIAIGEVSHRRN